MSRLPSSNVKSCLLFLTALAAMTSIALGQAVTNHITLPLWPHGSPQITTGPTSEINTTTIKSKLVAGRSVIRLSNVSDPTLTLYRPTAPNTHVAVVVFPGGGWRILAMDLEGSEVCNWLNVKGISCIVVKYRVPNAGPYPKMTKDLQDAQRAFRLVRQHASQWQIDPNRIGVLGFSAGAHLAAALSTHFQKTLYDHVDAADNLSCRPDFVMLIYPGAMHQSGDLLALNPAMEPSALTPPTFLVQAEDDPVHVENSIDYFLALKQFKVPAEMHIYTRGGHGFGLRPTSNPITHWPAVAEAWLRTIGILPQTNP